jgi:hypothetical protein
MLNAIKKLTRHCVDTATCHHALYGYLAAIYYLGCAGVVSKDQVAQAATAIYFLLSARG